jgi:hypothetical protein
MPRGIKAIDFTSVFSVDDDQRHSLPQFAPKADGSSRRPRRTFGPQYFATGSLNSPLHPKEK